MNQLEILVYLVNRVKREFTKDTYVGEAISDKPEDMKSYSSPGVILIAQNSNGGSYENIGNLKNEKFPDPTSKRFYDIFQFTVLVGFHAIKGTNYALYELYEKVVRILANLEVAPDISLVKLVSKRGPTQENGFWWFRIMIEVRKIVNVKHHE